MVFREMALGFYGYFPWFVNFLLFYSLWLEIDRRWRRLNHLCLLKLCVLISLSTFFFSNRSFSFSCFVFIFLPTFSRYRWILSELILCDCRWEMHLCSSIIIYFTIHQGWYLGFIRILASLVALKMMAPWALRPQCK